MADTGAAEVLSALAPLLKITPVIEDFCRFGGAWESAHAPKGSGSAQFHIVTRGACIVDRPGLEDLTLQAGDILLLPHGDSHTVRSRLRGIRQPISGDIRNGLARKVTADFVTDAEILCGRLEFVTSADNPLLLALPDEIVIRTADEPTLERYRQLLHSIRDELEAGKAGADVIASDLARAMFVIMLRDHLVAAQADSGTLSLLQDKATSRVVLALLKDLRRDWTLEDMTAVAITSRATLVRAFRKYAGVAPMAFLSELRLTTARKRLAGTSDPIASIAADVGYGSEYALSKAIMRRYGVRPGALRVALP